MNCTTCDTPLPAGATFCPNCGTRVPAASSAGSATTAMPAADIPPAPQPYAPQPYAPPASYDPPQPYADQWSDAAPLQPYTPPRPGYTQAGPPNSGAATVSLIFGILSWVVLPFIGAIIAVIAGHMARNEIRASNNQLGGSGMATAGLVLGYAQLALLVLGCVAFVLLFAVGAAVSR